VGAVGSSQYPERLGPFCTKLPLDVSIRGASPQEASVARARQRRNFDLNPRLMALRKIGSALLVDDDTAFRLALQGALRRRGVRALTAASVEEGARLLEDDSADLIAIDFRMPNVDGLSAIGRYRKLAPDAAIIMLTGFGDIPLTVAAMREGADTLLTKPVDVDRLLREAAAIPMDREAGRPPASARSLRLEEVERETIEAALSNSGGVVATAAKMLGIDRRTLQRKLKRLGS
jgi:two-component system response regulator RegA